MQFQHFPYVYENSNIVKSCTLKNKKDLFFFKIINHKSMNQCHVSNTCISQSMHKQIVKKDTPVSYAIDMQTRLSEWLGLRLVPYK